ncbi:DUF2500 domain-containing protein [Ornithinicoccus hortensis]|uniref:Uncharacterized protein DUF2500 n=1 Tax=Ornithinicoccus hortensis TaxID=82346 RepID=A0A542YTH9_9MICO|nr:DUF2500 domain-containing protein [Ornithinicoccus hortensis]TQL51395.1 uncharacterized protein DUF2500 [Ornithinicoccus hortensis]
MTGLVAGSFLIIFLGVLAVFAVIIVLIVTQVQRARRERQANEAAPVLTFPAQVVAKRTGTSGGGETRTRTHYFVTFQRPDGMRMELSVSGEEYGMLAEGDTGQVTHQGTWYRGFTRQ